SQEQLSRILRVFFISAGLIMSTGNLSATSESERDSHSLIKGKTLKRTNVVLNNSNQQRTLSGTVRNADGVPLEGVSVKVKGSTAATSTNAAGQY
ncbi:carboxypeptidase-like regulatory domain-containing protein, partial [Sphingobacterium hotanense]|uniref:carboxypeptidase-like regulatory domain-containing protein n=1 Tax=Sphingobacterium hotanense TaxID=649196 RepID=UPI0021A6A255